MTARSASDSRVLSFDSQRDWLEWIEDSKVADLRSIHTLVLRLADVNLSAALLHAPVEQSTSSRPSSNAWELYQKELIKLDKGLTSMPALVQIRIIPPRQNQSQLLRGMYLSFLKLVPRRFPKLQRLELADSNEVLKVVPELNQIAEVYCLQPAPTTASPPADSTTTPSRPPTLKYSKSVLEIPSADPKLMTTLQRLKTADQKLAPAIPGLIDISSRGEATALQST